jgi:hypothetical protein
MWGWTGTAGSSATPAENRRLRPPRSYQLRLVPRFARVGIVAIGTTVTPIRTVC